MNDIYTFDNSGNNFMPYNYVGNTRLVTAEHQNTAGFPIQFHYPEVKESPLYSNPEYASINLAPYNSDVVQNSQKEPIIGRYMSMVYDVPFDKIHFQKQQTNLQLAGFSLLALSLMFL